MKHRVWLVHATLVLSAVIWIIFSVLMDTFSPATALLSIVILLWATIGTVCVLLVSVLRGPRRRILAAASVTIVIAGLIASEAVLEIRHQVFLWVKRDSLEAEIRHRSEEEAPFVFGYLQYLSPGDDYYLVWDSEPSEDPNKFYNQLSSIDGRYDLGGGWFAIVR